MEEDKQYKLHEEDKIRSEPFIPWCRKRYTGPKPIDKPAEYAELLTDRDLKKPIEQLLCDVQEGYTHWLRDSKSSDVPEEMKKPIELILYSMARSTSMNAVVALENQKTQKQMNETQEQMKIMARNQQAINILLVVLAFLTFIPLLFKIYRLIFEFASSFH